MKSAENRSIFRPKWGPISVQSFTSKKAIHSQRGCYMFSLQSYCMGLKNRVCANSAGQTFISFFSLLYSNHLGRSKTRRRRKEAKALNPFKNGKELFVKDNGHNLELSETESKKWSHPVFHAMRNPDLPMYLERRRQRTLLMSFLFRSLLFAPAFLESNFRHDSHMSNIYLKSWTATSLSTCYMPSSLHSSQSEI